MIRHDPDSTVLEPLPAPPLLNILPGMTAIWFSPVFQRRIREALRSRKREVFVRNPRIYRSWIRRWIILCAILGTVLGVVLTVILKVGSEPNYYALPFVEMVGLIGAGAAFPLIVWLIIEQPRANHRIPLAIRLHNVLNGDKPDQVLLSPLVDSRIYLGEVFSGMGVELMSFPGGVMLLVSLGISFSVVSVFNGVLAVYSITGWIILAGCLLVVIIMAGAIILRVISEAIVALYGMTLPYLTARFFSTLHNFILVLCCWVFFQAAPLLMLGQAERMSGLYGTPMVTAIMYVGILPVYLVGDVLLGLILWWVLSGGVRKFGRLRRRR